MTRLYLNPFYQEEEEEDQNVQTKKETEKVSLSFCLLCKQAINYEERRFLKDVQYHYTLCLFRQGKFKEIVPPKNNDETKRQYICSQQGCSMREMRYKEYCVHEGIAHRKTQQLMARDPTLEKVSARLFELQIDFEIENNL